MTEIWNSWWGFIENWDISKVSLDILQSRVPRKLVLLIAAVIVSYLCVDPVISSWFYPEYDVDHYMLNLDILNPKQGKIYKPYARLYSDESGLITQKNNHGLPGYNIYPHTGINILIMGDSFVEAIEVPREQHFSYLTQVWLHRKKIDAQLINVGSRNHDPLAQYVRCQYYANRFQPDYLIYVIETPVYTDGFLYRRYGDRVHDINNWENPVFAPNKDILTNLQREIRNKSSFANLLSRLMPRRSDDTSEIVPNYVPLLERKWSYLGQIFDRLGAMIPGKLIVINIGIDNEFNAFLSKLCETKGMIYLQNSQILTPDNQLGGKGHLNVTGHQHLANLIYSSIKVAGIIPQELE